jgi:hypothetical protein
MKNKITIQPNPSEQLKDKRIMEISFFNSQGDYRGFLMSLRFCEDKPVVNLYQIDEDITVHVSEERSKPYPQ